MPPDDRNRRNSNRPVRLLHYADLENVYDHPERVGRLAGRIDALRDDSTLVVGAGDDTALGTLALFTDAGRAQARPFFEALSPDAETFGNHEFDRGAERALELARTTPQAWLCANVADWADGGRSTFPNGVSPSATFDAGDRRVGIVGVAHPKTAEMSGADLQFTDPAAAVNREAARLRERGADRVVALAHLGDDPAFAAAVDADAVLCGHETERRIRRIDGTLLVQTADGELAEVTLGDDTDVTVHDVTDAPLDEDVTATYRRRRAAAGVDAVVARVDDPIERAPDVRYGGECRLGNFVTDAYRAGADADVGFVHSASLREGPLLADDVTVGDVVGVAPFPTALVELELSGSDLRAAVEWTGEPFGRDDGVGLHVSGACVRRDEDGDLRAVRVGGDPLDAGATYSVALMNYLPSVEQFPTLTADDVVAEYGPQYEHLVAHARAGGLAAVECEGRIRRE
ncbi:5'-nucleotidase C-terminal domain-containing protein [Halomicrococcus sp. NG-SE-24]|uniref:5'-nucleotidase C-terminal domain-containing protein n=1 Tax=Halomicrococcus sp. NG-SE-24 TaxID=3436928 RepID=UPI003D977C8F